jgi:hypothetical protein
MLRVLELLLERMRDELLLVLWNIDLLEEKLLRKLELLL